MSKTKIARSISITEEQFLDNYIGFAAVHHWKVARSMFDEFRKLPEAAGERPHLALDILLSYCLLMEDVLMWYYALTEWRRGHGKHLMEILHEVKLDPAKRQKALNDLRSMSQERFNRLLGFPHTCKAEKCGFSRDEWESASKGLPALKSGLQRAIANFVEGKTGVWKDGTLVRCLNKLKHGLLVMLMDNPTSRRKMVGIFPQGHNAWLLHGQPTFPFCPLEEKSLRVIVEEVEFASQLLVALLQISFRARFRRRQSAGLPSEWLDGMRNTR